MHRLLAPGLFAAALLAATLAPRASAQPVTAADTVRVDSARVAAQAAAAAAAAQARADSIEAVRTMRARSRASYEAGTALLQASDYAGALIRFEDGLQADSSSAGNAYGRAFALAQLGRDDEAMSSFERAGALAAAVGDTATVRLARSSREGIVNRRAAAAAPVYAQVDALLATVPAPLEAGQQAATLMATLEGSAPEDMAYHYRWARALNAAERFSDASEHAEHAVAMSEAEEDRSAYYYELGVAYKGLGQNGPAIEAFQQARVGAWSAWADFQLNAMGVVGTGD